MAQLTGFSKLVIIGTIVGGALFGLKHFSKTETAGKLVQKAQEATESGPADVRVSVVTWGGYAGGQYFNRGFKPSSESEYTKKYGMKVEFILQDDVTAGRDAWKADKVDVIWATADSFPAEAKGLADYEPQIIMQSDWSRGGDAIVARGGISSMKDLRGKKVSVAIGTPSHSFLLLALKAADMTVNDIQVVEKSSAVDAASDFKAGAVDAAVVWSPDDEDCVQKVGGSRVLKSTKEASNIIADVFFVKKSFLQAHPDRVKNLVEGWLMGAAQINSDANAKAEAAKILEKELKVDNALAMKMINNARLTTLGDNKNFFGLTSGYKGVTGEKLYINMTQEYTKIGVAPKGTPDWRRISDSSIVASLSLGGSETYAEGSTKFSAPTPEMKTAEAFSSKKVSISFNSGSAVLDENAKSIIQMSFVDLAKSFEKSRIRIEGNTDSVGTESSNQALSEKRARAVVSYLVNEHGFDSNRFIVVGNGSKKPVEGASNDTAEGRAKNRRTDFEILN